MAATESQQKRRLNNIEDAGDRADDSALKRSRMASLQRQPLPQLGDLQCVIQLSCEGDASWRPETLLTLSQLAANATLPSCPWSYPLNSLYEALGLVCDARSGAKVQADFGAATFAIADADDWLDMLHEIWAQETDDQDPPVLRLRVTCLSAERGGPKEQSSAPREGHWFVRGAERSDGDWEACCRFMRHPPDRGGEGQGKVLLGSKVRLSREEMLDVHRYLRGITDGHMEGMLFSCPGRPSAFRVQMGIMCAARLSIYNRHYLDMRPGKAAGVPGPGVDCTHGHPFGIECACQTDSLTWRLSRRLPRHPMVVVARESSLATLAAAADRFFMSQIYLGKESYSMAAIVTVDGIMLKNAITGGYLCEMPTLPSISAPGKTITSTRSYAIILMKPAEAIKWLAGGGDMDNGSCRRAPLLLASHLYIHDWTPTSHFKLELLLGAMIGWGMLSASGERPSFSVTTPVRVGSELESVRPVAVLCLSADKAAQPVELASNPLAPSWMVAQGIAYQRATPQGLGCASIRASERTAGQHDAHGDSLKIELSNLEQRIQRLHSEGPRRGLDALVQQNTIYRGMGVERLRCLRLLPSLEPLWHDVWPETLLLTGRDAVYPRRSSCSKAVGELECCHLKALGELVRELRGKKAEPGHMVLLVPEAVLALVMTLWINERMGEECIAVWAEPDPGDASLSVMNVIRRLVRAEGERGGEGPMGKSMVIVASPGSIDGYWHSLEYIDWVVCFGEPWRTSEVDSVVSAICDGAGAGRMKEIEIVWMTAGPCG